MIPRAVDPVLNFIVQGGRYGPSTAQFRNSRMTIAKPPAPTEAISQRYPVCVEAIVVGLASVELPLVIRDVSRRGMSLAFANYAAAIDPRRVAVGAEVSINFKADIGGYQQRIKAQGEIRRRDSDGIGVRLVTVDPLVGAAMRGLILEAIAAHTEIARVMASPLDQSNGSEDHFVQVRLPRSA